MMPDGTMGHGSYRVVIVVVAARSVLLIIIQQNSKFGRIVGVILMLYTVCCMGIMNEWKLC